MSEAEEKIIKNIQYELIKAIINLDQEELLRLIKLAYLEAEE